MSQTKDGVIKGLAERGFVVGKNLKIDYQNANGSMPTQQQIAEKFIGEGVDVIVPITTPTFAGDGGGDQDHSDRVRDRHRPDRGQAHSDATSIPTAT